MYSVFPSRCSCSTYYVTETDPVFLYAIRLNIFKIMLRYVLLYWVQMLSMEWYVRVMICSWVPPGGLYVHSWLVLTLIWKKIQSFRLFLVLVTKLYICNLSVMLFQLGTHSYYFVWYWFCSNSRFCFFVCFLFSCIVLVRSHWNTRTYRVFVWVGFGMMLGMTERCNYPNSDLYRHLFALDMDSRISRFRWWD